MTTIEIIQSTEAYKEMTPTFQSFIILPQNIGILENVIELKKSGWNYNQWLSETCASLNTKKIAKEIFAA